MFKLGKTSKLRLKGVSPQLIEVINLSLKISKVDFGIPEFGGVRTKEEQNKLFSKGSSKADGYVKLSNHQTGEAFDVYAYVDGKASWEYEHLAMVACAILQAASMLGYSMSWGGLWSTKKIINGIAYGWDAGHFELN